MPASMARSSSRPCSKSTTTDGTLVCDYGVDAALTERLLAAPQPHVRHAARSRPCPVRSERCGRPKTTRVGRRFASPLPEVVTRLQRREHYRLKVPRGRPLYCQLTPPVEAAGSQDREADRRSRLRHLLRRCRAHGMARRLRAAAAQWSYPTCGSSSPTSDVWSSTFASCTSRARSDAGPNAGRFGCRFANANHGATMLVQRYINRIEREQRALM